MFLKREVRRKDGKEHVYYYLAESTRVGRDRVVQRRLLNLGELNTTQIDRWQRSIEVIEEDGRACQRRLWAAIGRVKLRSRRRTFAKWCSQASRCVGPGP
jgi:hypothetical protein